MLRAMYIQPRFYAILMVVILLFIVGVFVPACFVVALIVLGVFPLLVGADVWYLFGGRNPGIDATREVADHLSNGDPNVVRISVQSQLPYRTTLRIIDELPVQFQSRHTDWHLTLDTGATEHFSYEVRPVERGAYAFGAVHVFAPGPLKLVSRRFSFAANREVKVYPSYLQLRRYAFLAFDQRLKMPGTKRMRRLGHTTEFEHIKEYVPGDDARTINWKATARTGTAMVNQYRDERAQPVYCLIDKGRLMQMPFEGMTLLDYAINASLVMSYIAVRKEDNAGILTFAENTDDFVLAGRRNNQMYRISEALYRQETDFLEADFERLYVSVTRMIRQRSLLLVFTNFESISGLKRQLPYFVKLAEKHLVVLIFFRNTELRGMIEGRALTVRHIYHQTIAELMQEEKEGMLALIRQHGMIGLLTTPQELTVDTINKYLELKARGSM